MIVITYETDEQEFVEWKLIGRTETPVMKQITRRHRITWSKDDSEVESAKTYITNQNCWSDYQKNRQIHIISDTDESWDSL